MSECGIPYVECAGIGLATVIVGVVSWALLIWATMRG